MLPIAKFHMNARREHQGLRVMRILAAGGLTLGVTGCDNLVDFTIRDNLPPEAIENAAGAQALYVGAIRGFAIAFAGDGGGTEGQVIVSGTMADEFQHSGTFNTRTDYDKRDAQLNNGTLAGVFRNLNTARTSAQRAVDAMLTTGAQTSDPRLGDMYNRIGAVFLYGGTNYCNGVAFSSQTASGELIYGTQITNAQALDSAKAYFALAQAVGDPNNTHLARLLTARAMMMEGTGAFAAAAALVANVPTTFRAINEHSVTANQNGIYVFNTQNERFSLAHLEGGNGLPFRGAGAGTDAALADPRIPWKRDGGDLGFDNQTPQYDLLIYTGRESSSVWAKGEEARLIEAEALLQAGQTGDWLGKLNALRLGTPGLLPLTDPGTAAGRVDLMFQERAFWLFATATRLADMRRLIRQYGRGAESLFPSGVYPRPNVGGSYGSDVNFPIPDIENQNPAINQTTVVCIDRNA